MTTLCAPRILATLALALVVPAAVRAETITLNTTSLPSAQGWTYVAAGDGAGAAETSIYSVADGLLHQNSMGVGMSQGGGNWYQRSVQLAPGVDWSMTLVARLLAFESVTTPEYPFGLFLGANADIAVGFGSDNIQYLAATGQLTAPLPGGFDASVDHSYEFKVVGGLQSFAIDGVAVFDAQPLPAGIPSAILFGDGTGYANARADITSFTFTSSVPEPGTWALVLAGLGVLVMLTKRRRMN